MVDLHLLVSVFSFLLGEVLVVDAVYSEESVGAVYVLLREESVVDVVVVVLEVVSVDG